MEYRKFQDKLYIRLDRGDELVASVTAICQEENIEIAQVQGIGGCEEVCVGVFDLKEKTYHQTKRGGMLEMISLDGNITLNEGKPFLHAHASFAYEEDGCIQTVSGHLLSAVIGLTGEIVLTPVDGHIRRKFIPETGIRIWDFD